MKSLDWPINRTYAGTGYENLLKAGLVDEYKPRSKKMSKEQERKDAAFDMEIDRLREMGRFDLVKKKIGTVGDPPPHYSGGIEPIKFIQSHGMDYATGAAVKYLVRFRHKGTPLEDLMKCKAYIDLLLSELED